VKTISRIIAFLVIILAGFFLWRYFTAQGRSAWVCRGGEWVKQGFPKTAKPTGTCLEGQVLSDEARNQPTPVGVGLEGSKQIAQQAVEASPTYKFDGFDLKFDSVDELPCADCWEFKFSFKSRSGGYGDRSGQAVIQVITAHTTTVTTQEGKITSVVTDKTFDELRGRFIK
jgi:hypothetical protein